MALDILDDSLGDYDAIRAALDLASAGLAGDDPSQVVTDAVIEMIIYGGRAELYIMSRDPLWATRTDAELALLRQAAIFLTASFLSNAIPVLIKESFGDYAYTRSDNESGSLRGRLRSAAEEALTALLGETILPRMFTVACGRRGQ